MSSIPERDVLESSPNVETLGILQVAPPLSWSQGCPRMTLVDSTGSSHYAVCYTRPLVQSSRTSVDDTRLHSVPVEHRCDEDNQVKEQGAETRKRCTELSPLRAAVSRKSALNVLKIFNRIHRSNGISGESHSVTNSNCFSAFSHGHGLGLGDDTPEHSEYSVLRTLR